MKTTANHLARTALTSSVALFALALPSISFAQDAAAEEEMEGNEIVVTATKRDQTLQEVPVAVSVTTAETIERAQIRDIKDLSSVVPSLRVNQLQSSANTNFYIRGFGNGANNAGIEPSVGLFVDGVYRSRSASMIADLPDVQRVEVLRGPQSTLFGKNASAGVISMVTRKPSFNFGGNVEASYGKNNAMVLKGVVTGPISESMAVSLAGGMNKRDGYVSDLGTGNKTNERDRWFLRGQMLFEPSNDLSVRVIGDYAKIKENCCAVVNLRSSAATGAVIGVGGKVNSAATPFADEIYGNRDSTNDITNWGLSGQIDYNLGSVKLTSITAFRRTGALTNQDSDFTSADLLGTNAQDLTVDTFTQEFRASTDSDGPLNGLLGAFYFKENIDQTNQIAWGAAARPYANLLIQGASGGALNAVLLENTFGALEGNQLKYQNTFFKNGTGFNEAYRLKDEALSIFGQLDFKVGDRFTLTGGANYTHDSKRFSTNTVSNDVFAGVDFNAAAYAPFRNQLLYQGALAKTMGFTVLGLGRNATAAEIGAFAGSSLANFTTFTAVNNGSIAFANANMNVAAANPLNGLKPLQFFPPFMNVPNAVENGRVKGSNWSFTARAAYEISDTLNVYAAYATGYKAASINLSRDSRPTAADLTAIKTQGIGVTNLTSGSRFANPEKAAVMEMGIKGNWGLASANLTVFKQTIKDFQSNIFTGTGFFLANAGKQSSYGVEFEGTANPTKELTLSVAVTYLDPKYDSFLLSAFGDLSGSQPAGVTKLSTTLGAQYDRELGNGDHIILRGDWHYEAPFQLVEGLPNFVSLVGAAGAVQAARDFKQEISQVSASLTYAMNSGLEVTVWGRNLTDNRTILQIFDSPAQQGSISGYPGEPRSYGLSARYRF